MQQDQADHVLLICATCKGASTPDALHAALSDALPSGFAVRFVDCMAGCDTPRTVGFQAAHKATYLFGDIEGQADVAALVAFAGQYQASADGWTNASDRPKALFRKTVSRMPALRAQVSQ